MTSSAVENLRRFRLPLFCAFAFALATTLSFLTIKNLDKTAAADLSRFNAGDIMNDETMSDYGTMNEADIYNFLKSKNSCNNTNTWVPSNGRTTPWLDMSGTMNWHVENGHFVCMADERFDGESAAHIIWQAAQDYRINPQVLIVLLEKEQGLVTDTRPRSGQYRSAAGYGCPDTAACDAQYYGFKNQVRNAASLFRWILNHGSRYKPVGDNYIQYSPNSACGGSIVNIKNRATSALYQYTPYQPNAGALAAGYGTASCGAYGNRNFYAYFTDWFGDTHAGFFRANYTKMDTPRILIAKRTANSLATNKRGSMNVIQKGTPVKFSQRTIVNNETCLKTVDDINSGNDRCYYYLDFNEFKGTGYWAVDNPRTFYIPAGTKKINTSSNQLEDQTLPAIETAMRVKFVNKTDWFGRLCLRTELDAIYDRQACIPYDALKEIRDVNFVDMDTAQIFVTKANAYYIDPEIDMPTTKIPENTRLTMFTKLYIDGKMCLRTEEDTRLGKNRCVYFSDLMSTSDTAGKEYYPMATPRYMKLSKDTLYILTSGRYISPITAKKDEILHFSQRTIINNDTICLRSDMDSTAGIPRCIPLSDLTESPVAMDTKRSLITTANTKKLVFETDELSPVHEGATIAFIEKYYTAHGLCLRSEDDAKAGNAVCYVYNTLKEL